MLKSEENSMELVYAGLLLHSLKKEINEAHLTSVLKAAGSSAEAGAVKAFLAALQGVNIEEAIAKAAVAPAAAAPAAAGAPAAGEAKAEKKEDTAKKEEEAAAGLGALFG
jgi:large subunit ribosomal protein L12